jgi:hypothetical protein
MALASLPTLQDYIAHTNALERDGSLTVEQVIILQQCYKRTLDDLPTDVNYLMFCTNLNWKNINYLLNGLVMRGALVRIEKGLYKTKIK